MYNMNKESELVAILELRVEDLIKAQTLRSLVVAGELEESFVIKNLITRHEKIVLELFVCTDEYDVKVRKMPAASGSSWDDKTLRYYKVEFEDVDQPEKIIPQKALPVATSKAELFLNCNKDLTPATFADQEVEISLANTPFKKHIMFLTHNPSKESCVDDVFKSFLSSILDDSFLIKTHYDMNLQVSKTKKKATADIVVVHFPSLTIGVVVIEDKSRDASRKNSDWTEAEAQLIAEGISVAQQKRWPENMPVFMILVLDTYVSIYRALFTSEFLNSVKIGIKRNRPFVVTRYAPTSTIFEGQRPGCNLLKHADREIIVRLLIAIQEVVSSKLT
ncbi:hypothetical protein CONCODRAFT_167604 [Conidiobolus coronatus NRRL 28638]|uniref:Uncharacterized protein n=1 Tax=Conidiobolus coronatus (strain ATCC 28846 / CBS 209.66 / NRRL 28638) TaxID=796925 RepID=A0A137PE50_CONC2|nr:hypothetical protein CONCODRAFT_167604 [Conidiobolus coronatus NRRL 28638]|eukprot:KXN73245.1 hypothetical protein CONCODRAFT_167604 [Conidiobolus coronatus NRRL 28638]